VEVPEPGERGALASEKHLIVVADGYGLGIESDFATGIAELPVG
jgi:hypothetical protein